MQRRSALLLVLAALAAGPAAAAPPAVTLLVELRWVDSQLPASAQAGVRDGAVVVGTAGSVSPRGPGLVTSTAQPAPAPVQRLLVRNGERARLTLTSVEPLQPVDAVVEIDPSAAPASAVRRVYASPRPAQRRDVQSIAVQPSWPGGRAPVRLAFAVEDEAGRFESTLDLPLERWQAVARTGSASAPSARGTVSSRDAAGQPQRELQIRVGVQ